MTKAVLAALLVLCAVCVNSDDPYGHRERTPEHVRIKRAKYYSSPPIRFYRRPPITHPVKGIFSYTPPPNYMSHDEPHPGNFKPKVSKRPTNSGLEDEDINNIVKHLSKQDLDKIIEFAGEKYREPSFEKYGPSSNKFPVDEVSHMSVHKESLQEFNKDQKYMHEGPHISNYEMDYKDNSKPPGFNGRFKPLSDPEEFMFRGPLANAYNAHEQFPQSAPSNSYHMSQSISSGPPDLNDVHLHTEESMKNNQFSFVDSYIQQELLDGAASQKIISSTHTDGGTWREEPVPKPNVREDQDYQLASTNDVPNVVKSDSYQVENFGELPLMDYNSKRDSVSSYHVPHYTVVSPSYNRPSPPSAPPYGPQSSPQLVSSPSASAIKVPKLEPAPPVSAAREQSDAHLKATKIWTHKSRGTAYTLHDDGTLSPERPGRPKPVYGP